jgi:hypothetical protein
MLVERLLDGIRQVLRDEVSLLKASEATNAASLLHDLPWLDQLGVHRNRCGPLVRERSLRVMRAPYSVERVLYATCNIRAPTCNLCVACCVEGVVLSSDAARSSRTQVDKCAQVGQR